jgi:sugar lactone lactonase YvrE
VYKSATNALTFSYSDGLGSSGNIASGVAISALPTCKATSIRLNTPQSVAGDAAGNLYISDFNNHVIEKVAPSGAVSIFAGTGQVGPPRPGPATASPVDYPIGVAVDSTGNLYIADLGNRVIEKVTPTGKLSIVAGVPGVSGTPTPGPATKSPLSAPIGAAVDGSGNIYIADQGIQGGANNVVEKVTPAGSLSIFAGKLGASGSPTPGPATNSKLNYPQDVAVDGDGNVFIADSLNGTIEKVNQAGVLSIYAGVLGGGTGTPTPGPATQSKFNTPNGVAVDGSGNLYVSDTGNNMIEKVNTSGVLSIVAGTGSAGAPTVGSATNSMLNMPTSIGFAAGSLYIADTYNNEVEKLNSAGMLSIVAGGI